MSLKELIRASIIIPVLNEEEFLPVMLTSLQSLRANSIEILLSDGGSTDQTVLVSEGLVDKVVNSLPGRAIQMNSAAAEAKGQLLIFLHADTKLPNNIDEIISDLIKAKTQWGFFRIKLSGRAILLRMVERFMNWRSRTWGVGTGDQTHFIQRALFIKEGGYKNIPLMEDVDFCSHFGEIATPFIVNEKVITSSRRWERDGIWQTIWLMWRLRFAYYRGALPVDLVKEYYD